MTQVTLPKKNQTGTNEWADVQDNDEAIADVVNGELEDDNIAAEAGIAGTKLGSGISGSKLNDTSVPLKKLEKKVPETPISARMLWGRVNPFAGINGGSSGFTVTKEATGIFVVNFTAAFSTDVTPVVTDAGEAGQHYIRVTNVSPSSFRVAIFNGSFNLEDSSFNFIAIG